jgi:PAS domain S-box-containing protein
MKKALRLLLIILGSIVTVYAQKASALDQWMIFYSWIFFVAWIGGMVEGIVATVTGLGLAALVLIPEQTLGTKDIVMLLILTGLGVWVSYTMEKHHYNRKKVEENFEIRKAKGFLDSLLDNIPLMVFVKDAQDLRYLNFNQFGLNLLGISREEVLGKNDHELFPRGQAEFFQSLDLEVLKSLTIRDIPVEEIQTKDGKRLLHTRKIPVVGENGKPLYLLGVSEDITEKIIREKKYALELQEEAALRERNLLRERENIVARAISTLSESIDYEETIIGFVKAIVPALGDWAILSLVNEEGKIQRTAGAHKDEKLTEALNEFMHDYPINEFDDEIHRAFQTGFPTLQKTFSDDELRTLPYPKRKIELYLELGTNSWVIIPVRTRDGILGVLSISRDKSREPFDELDFALAQEFGRRAGTILDNTKLFQSTQKAVRARDEFLSIASHELKTPITSLKLQLEMMLRPGKASDPSKIQNAVKQVDRLTLLVNDLLDVGRLESGKMNYHIDVVSIAEVVKEVTEAMHPHFLSTGTSLNVSVEGNPIAFVDRYRMEQVLVNLLNNAQKYGLGKPVDVVLTKENNDVILVIRDRGVGIAQSHIQKIFGKFERGGKVSSIAGLGLGLYITREIITAFKGDIKVQSREGELTEFVVTLPGA